jgi:DNA topoisomerase VI subunit B
MLLQKAKNPQCWHGTRLTVTIQGAWTSHRVYIFRYLRQIAVITPYAQISFTFKSLDGKGDIDLMFRRRTTTMPDPPLQVRACCRWNAKSGF